MSQPHASALPPIQGLWIGDRLSRMEQLSIRSCLSLGHPYHLYTYGDISGIPDGTTVMDGNEILPSASIFHYQDATHYGSVAAFSNVFRFKLLAERGGIWFDSDMVLLKPLAIAERYVYSSERRTGKVRWYSVGTVARIVRNKVLSHADPAVRRFQTNVGVIKVPPGSPIMRACYERAAAMDPRDLSWRMNGPDVLAQCVVEFQQTEQIAHPDVFMPIHYGDLFLYVKPGARIELPERALALHLWNERWRLEAKRRPGTYDKDRLYPADTFYGALQRRFLDPE